MKLEVFEYLIAIEKYGSLNKAAQSLYISQPNLSNVIKNFENEIGYAVIARHHQGVYFTDKGKQVLMIAHNMMREKDKLLNIKLDHQKISFKISIGNGDYALFPIYQIINQQSFEDEINITILNCSVWEAIEKTYEQSIDIAYFIIPKSMEKTVLEYSQSHHLLFHTMQELMCQISVREGHPLLNDFSKERLWNYPFIDFINQKPNVYETYQQYINPNKVIEVDHHSLRQKLIQETDAFSIGISTSIKQIEGIINIPTPELKMVICEIRRMSDQNNILFNHCRKLIEQNLRTI